MLPGRVSTPEEESRMTEAVAKRYQSIVMSGKLRQAVFWATNREDGGCLLPDE